jgi:hypothetical protein
VLHHSGQPAVSTVQTSLEVVQFNSKLKPIAPFCKIVIPLLSGSTYTRAGVSIKRLPGSANAAPVTSLAPPHIPTLYHTFKPALREVNFMLTVQ